MSPIMQVFDFGVSGLTLYRDLVMMDNPIC
jgi:hypothetical protein